MRKVLSAGLTSKMRKVLSAAVAGKRLSSSVGKVVASYNTTGLEVYRKLGVVENNVIISPSSLGTAMAMVLAGADGDTWDEMSEVLGHRLQQPEIDTANEELLAAFKDASCVGDVHVHVANALFSVSKYVVCSTYRERLTRQYEAEFFAGSSMETVNNWVKERTEGKIKEIVANAPDPLTLLNAIYFKGLWQHQFDERWTKPDEFHLTKKRKTSVQMMDQTEHFKLVEYDTYRALSLPYASNSSEGLTSFVLVLPREVDGLKCVEPALAGPGLLELAAKLSRSKRQSVHLKLPRFEISYDAPDLANNFKSLGMRLPFDPERADFSTMEGQPRTIDRLYIGEIKHKAWISVTEEATEATAATAVEIPETGAPPNVKVKEPVPFIVDRPFLFFIWNENTDAILFMGRIRKPEPVYRKTSRARSFRL